MNIEDSLKKLFSLHTFGMKLGLDNIKKFLDTIGNPQLQFKTIHVAGSNGKGSTSAFLASMLKEFGYKVGLYTSPHFVRFNERVKINGLEIPDEYVADFISKHEKYIDDNKLTFFEVTTAIAFQYFYDKKVDHAIIEAGLGGRLDATNVLNPLACVITSISLEHTNILGETLEKIAFEKAGIIKKYVPVYTGILPPEAKSIIQDKCIELNSPLNCLQDYIIKRGSSIELYTEEIELDDFTMPLKGDYQKLNAALAGLVISRTFQSDDFAHIEKGIRNVFENTGIQGRYEFYNQRPDIIFDSAHNEDGIKNFISEFRKDSKHYSKKVLLFGAMRDKNISSMLKELNNYFDEIFVTEIDYERAAKIEEIKNIAAGINVNVLAAKNYIEFIDAFMNNSTGDCLVVLGSMYLIGSIKAQIQNKIA